jgi:chemotaxis protein MotA
MNISTLAGSVLAIGCLVFSIVANGNPIIAYLDIPSVILVVVGPIVCIFIYSSIGDAIKLFKLMGRTFKTITFNKKIIITKMVSMSEKARREGLLALEEDVSDIDDEFIKMGLRLVVDGTDAGLVRDIMESELSQMQERHTKGIMTVNTWGALGPAIGMMGTVVGLVGMLRNLEDKSAVGPNMAVALLTTLYGAMTANMMAIPFSGKLKGYDAAETSVKEMMIEGVLSIQAGDNPRILALKLLSFLEPSERRAVEAEVLKD